MSEPTTALAEQEPDPLIAMMQMAINKGFDAGQLERVAATVKTMRAEQAREAFYRDMTACQSEMPPVVRDKHNQQTNSRYASRDAVNATIKECYTRYGFSLSFSERKAEKEKHIGIQCVVRHRQGHSEDHWGEYAVDDAGIKGSVNKTPIHAERSSMSYGCRYLTCDIFNITIANEDNDGQTRQAPSEGVLAEQVEELAALFTAADSLPGTKINPAKFFAWVSTTTKRDVEKAADLDQNQYLVAKAELLSVIAEKRKAVEAAKGAKK